MKKNGCYNCGHGTLNRNGKITCSKKLGSKRPDYICFSWSPKETAEELFLKGVILGSVFGSDR